MISPDGTDGNDDIVLLTGARTLNPYELSRTYKISLNVTDNRLRFANMRLTERLSGKLPESRRVASREGCSCSAVGNCQFGDRCRQRFITVRHQFDSYFEHDSRLVGVTYRYISALNMDLFQARQLTQRRVMQEMTW